MANNTLIGAIRTEATLESGKFVDGAKKIRLASKQTEDQVKKSFGGMSSSIRQSTTSSGGFIKGFVGALGVAALVRIGKAALDYSSNLKSVSQQLGVTTRDLQVFRYAAEQNNVTQADADKGLEKLALSMSQAASGSKPMIAAFKSVGVEVADIKKKGPVELFGQMADAMNRQGGAAKNAAAGAKIMGEGFQKFIPLASQGSRGINELSQAAERLGVVLSDEQIQNADRTADKLDDVKRVLSAQIAGVVADNAQSILSLSSALASLTSAIVNFLGSNPQLALGIIGALSGASIGRAGGVVGVAGGALIGGLAGANVGFAVGHNARDAKQDVAFRRQQFVKAENEYQHAVRAIGKAGAFGAGGAVDKLKAERDKQEKLFRGAIVESRKPKAQPLPGSPPPFLAPTPRAGGGRRQRTARAPRDRSDDLTYQFQREQMQADADILRAKQAMAQSATERNDIELQLIELERQMQNAEVDDRVRRAQRDYAEGKITKSAFDQVTAQAEILKEKNDQVARLRAQAVIEERQRQVEEDTFRADQEKRDMAISDLQALAQMAETQSERRAIQLQILNAELEQKRLELEHQKQLAIRNGATQQEIDAIQARIDHIATERAQGTAAIMQQTRGPYEDWLASLPTTAAKAQEALERLEVEGFNGLIDAALALSEGFDSAKDALLNTLKQFLLGLARMQLQQGLASLLGSSNPLGFLGGLFGGSSGGVSATGSSALDFGGSFDAVTGALPKFAGGGAFSLLGRRGIDRNLLSLNGLPIARVSYGERVSVSNDNYGHSSSAGGRPVIQNFNFPNSDFDSFRRNETQAARIARRRLQV